MANYYPPVGFHFNVEFVGLSNDATDIRFQSVAGLSVDLQTESRKEGGENRFEHILPIRTKYQNLTLKRGVVTDSTIIDWCFNAFNTLSIDPVDMIINLLNKNHEPLYTWNIVHAWPKKWQVSDFSAEESKLVIETIELQYHYFSVG